MKWLYIAVLAASLGWSGSCPAHPRAGSENGLPDRSGRHSRISETAGEPHVRIREDTKGAGLAPLEFARWIAAHPRFSYLAPPMFRLASSPTRLLNRASIFFKAADANGNGRVSAAELADFIDPSAVPERRSSHT